MIPEQAPNRRLIAALKSTKMMAKTTVKAVKTKVILNMLRWSVTYSLTESTELVCEESGSIEGFSFSLVSKLAHKLSSPLGEFSTGVAGEDASKGSNAPKARGIYHAVGKKTEVDRQSPGKTLFLLKSL